MITIVLAITVLANVIFLYNTKEQLINLRKSEIEQVVIQAKQKAQVYVEKHQQGELSKQQAEIALINSLTQDNNGSNYIWINDNHAISRAHIRPEKIGIFQTSYIDHLEKLENADLVFITETNVKPGIEERVLKINGVTKIPKWNWVIGYGVYLDEVEQAFLNQTLKTLPINGVILAFCITLIMLNRKQKPSI